MATGAAFIYGDVLAADREHYAITRDAVDHELSRIPIAPGDELIVEGIRPGP